MSLPSCPNCGASNPASVFLCQSCGAFMPWNTLLSVAGIAASWFSYSLITVNLVNYTAAAPTPTPTPTPTPVAAVPLETPDGYVPSPPPEKPPEVNRVIYEPVIKDNKGRAATIAIYLLTDDYRWAMGRWDLLENNERQVDFSPAMTLQMNHAAEVICIGASSEEMEPGLSYDDGRRREEWRAEQRAEAIAKWVRATLRRPANVRKLNIGHRDPASAEDAAFDTSDQRRVIIILVLKEDEGIDFDQALRNKLREEKGKQPIYNTILTRYSLTQGLTFHWVQ